VKIWPISHKALMIRELTSLITSLFFADFMVPKR